MNKRECASQHFGMWLVDPTWIHEAANAVRSGLWEPGQTMDGAAITIETDNDDDDPYYNVDQNGIATIPIAGHMVKHRSSFGGTSTVEARKAVVKAGNDPNVKGILLQIDSPGGSVAGTFDLAQSVDKVNKPIHAYAQDMMASAALLVGTQADHVSGNYNALIGSIGVVSQVADYSEMYEAAGVKVHTISTGKYKGAFAKGSEITDEQLEYLQARVDRIHDLFVNALTHGRELSEEHVRELSTGETWVSHDAVDVGLADAIETIDDAYARLDAAISGNSFTSSTEEKPMFGKGTEKAADEEQGVYERLDGIEDAFSEFGDAGSDLALKAFRCGIEPDQAKALAGAMEKALEAELEGTEATTEKLEALEAELEEARGDLEAKDEEIDGLKERLGDGNHAIDNDETAEDMTGIDFDAAVEERMKEEDLSRGDAMKAVREDHPDAYQKWHDAQQS